MILVFSMVVSGASVGMAADEYPSSDIKHILPWSAGGGTDTVMRAFMNNLEDKIGTSIYTVNISGANSGQGVGELMGSKPDGYTIGTLTYDSIVTVPYFGLLDNYSMDRLSFIGLVTDHPTVIAVHSDSEYETIEDLVKDAEENPGKVAISNVGLGGVWHLPAVDFEQQAGVTFNHVAFPGGSGEQREALLKKEVPVACISVGGVYPAVKAGKARILAVMSDERMDDYPDVPTFNELGYDLLWGSMRVLAVPKGTPEDRMAILEEACEKTAHDEKWINWLNETGGGGWAWRGSEETKDYVYNLQARVFELLDELVEAGIVEK